MERYANVFIRQYIRGLIKKPDGLKGTMSNFLTFWSKHRSNLYIVNALERRPKGTCKQEKWHKVHYKQIHKEQTKTTYNNIKLNF